MSWNLTAAPSRRAAARLLVAHRAGLVRLGPDEDFCLMVVSSAILVQKMRNKVGRLWKFQASEVDSWVRSGGAGGK